MQMTLNEAANYFGLSTKELNRLTVDGINNLIKTTQKLERSTVSRSTKNFCIKEIVALETLLEYAEGKINA